MLTEKEELELLELENENALAAQEPEPQASEPEKNVYWKSGEIAEKGSRPWLESEITKHRGELKENPSLAPIIKIGGDVARSAGYTFGKVFEPLTKPIMSTIGKAIPEPIKKFAGETATSATEAYRDIIPDEGTRDIISSVGAVGATALGLKAPSIAKGAKKVTGEALEEFGKNTPNRILKPKERDFNAGFKPENIYKYDVDGTLDQTIKKTQDKIETLSKELKNRIQIGDDAGARVDAFSLIDGTIEKMKGEGVKNLNKRQAINQLQALKEEISMSNPDGILDLADAQDFKRAVGSEGAWYESKWGRMVDKDATAKEQAYSNLYTAIKNDIELKAPEGIKEINQQLSELIPIENTALKRLYVAKRNEPISLKDMIGLAAVASAGWKAAPVYLLNKTLNSPTTGKAAYKAGMALQGKKNLPSEIPALKPKTETITPEIEPDFETPTYLRKGRSPLPEQPLETEWKKPTFQETPTSAKMMQLLEDFNKKKPEGAPIEGIDYMSRDAAGDLAQQVTEKKKLPVMLPLSTNLISNDIKKEVSKFIKEKKPEEPQGSGFIKSIKDDVTIDSFNKWFTGLSSDEKTDFMKRLGKKYPEKTKDDILTSKELANKRVPSSLMTQEELSKLRWSK